ncbi:MAG: ATP-dependent metallopeptidase FtsH/Yme1/Tma family protein, partial [Ilumatobacter sp.]|uniref:ATP-dependent metallopeptidase FtsH/Yme1/Tma family protein n=1 Tax=Ilumatobacter sp. TaxID=1967498 RepID=UPI003C7962E3
MSNLPPPPPPPPPGGSRGQKRPGKPERPAPKNKFTPSGGSNDNSNGTGDGETKPGFPKWGWWIVGLVALGALLIPSLWPSNDGDDLTYTEFIAQVEQGNVETADINTGSGKITGDLTNGDQYNSSGGGERGVSENDEALLRENGVKYEFTPPSNNFLLNLLGFMLPIFLIIGFL